MYEIEKITSHNIKQIAIHWYKKMEEALHLLWRTYPHQG